MISTTASSASYVGNASTVTSYAITFPLAAASHLVVEEINEGGTRATLDPGVYTFTPTTDGNGRITGGSLTTNPAIPATSTLIVSRATPKTQTLDLVDGARLPAESMESALDRIAMMIQELQRDLDAAEARIAALEP